MGRPPRPASMTTQLLPLVFAEAVALFGCLLAFVLTGKILWVWLAALAGLAFAPLFFLVIVRNQAQDRADARR